jgi:hypothetical protein
LNAGIDGVCSADVAGCWANNRATTSRVPDIQRRAWLVKALAFTGDVV